MKRLLLVVLFWTIVSWFVPWPADGASDALDAVRAAAARGDPATALSALRGALTHDGDDLEVLRACTEIAHWNAEYTLALDCWRRLLEHPEIDAEGAREASLGRARTTSWAGDGDRAVVLYRRHVESYASGAGSPSDTGSSSDTVLLEWARAEAWRGNAPGALDVLDRYRSRFGVDDAYRRELAFVLADPRPRASLDRLDDLLAEQPDDAFLRGIEPLALAGAGRPREALDSLDRLRAVAPDAERTRDIERAVETPLRSAVTPFVELYDDSDSITRSRVGVDARVALRPAVALTAQVARGRYEADAGSGLEAGGGRPLHVRFGHLGLDTRPAPWLRLAGTVGESSIEEATRGRDELTTYRLVADLALGDDVDLRLAHGRELFDLSPRALDLGLDIVATEARLEARLGRRTVVDAAAAFGDLSDGNERLDLVLAPRRVVVRRQHWNLDVGLRGRWLSFDRRAFGNGYYAPDDYRRFDLTAFGYWKISDQRGLSVVAAAGPFKDETMEDHELAFDVTLDLTLGIFSDWQLRLLGAYTNNDRVATGAFDAVSGRVSLTRRF